MSKVLIRAKHKKVMSCIEAENYDEARALLKQLCHTDKRNAQTWFLLSAVNGQLELYKEALQAGLKAIKLKPDFIDAHYNLAQAYMHLGDLTEAAQCYQSVLALNTNHIDAMYNLACVCELQNDYPQAIDLCKRVLAVDPDHDDACNSLGNLLIDIGGTDEGLAHLRRAIKINPAFIKAHVNLGYALYHRGQLDEAEKCFEQVSKLEPDGSEAVLGKAALLEKSGNVEGAYALIAPLFEAGVRNRRLALVMARVAKTSNRIKVAIQLLEELLNDSDLIDSERQPLHLGLGRLYDEIGEPDFAFPHFQSANQLRPVYCKAEENNRTIDEIISTYTCEYIQQTPCADNEYNRPIFIVGMPRSGTSLIEQILSSHAQVYGGGELKEIEYISKSLLNSPGISQASLNKAAQNYIKHLDYLDAKAVHVTDKMPHNFMHLGLIELLFPNAHVIHCKRNPADTCLSIYFNDFNAAHGYATDLEQLGEHYKKYEKIMQHWKDVLSIPILDVCYEELVENQEEVTRSMIKFINLDWDEDCLKFHESKRVINTFSYDQVRRPLYKKSVNRWKSYQHHLQPLLAKLAMPY